VSRLLRDRVEDIPELIEYFIKEAAAEVGSKVTGITGAAQTILSNFDWPGNLK
jgi:transcriptional regulator with PAS, ATPase and Fis domain